MKIAVLNSSGNVGKSTITRDFLYPRLEAPLIVEIETVNSSNIANKNLNIEKYSVNEDISELYIKMVENENVIVDIGASNLAHFFEQVLNFDGFIDLFDFFIIPCVSTIKETEDTIKTILFLKTQSVEENKIKVILNKVESDPKNEFSILIKNSPIKIDLDFQIKFSKLFSDLALLKMDLESVKQDNLDFYKTSILEARSAQEKMRFIKMDLANRMAFKLTADFDSMFEKMFSSKPLEAKSQTKKTSKAEKEIIPDELNTEESEDF